MLDAVVADFQKTPGVELAQETGRGTFSLVIAPEFDDHLLRQSQAVLDAGGWLLGSSLESIRLTADKLATARFWRKSGVPHPRTEFFDPAEPRLAPPWVLKPRYGTGSQATFLISQHDDAPSCVRAARSEWPRGDFLAQQYVFGQHASVALLIGAAQAIALMPARQDLSGDGRFRYLGGSLPLPEPLAERATRLALRAVAGIEGLRGYVGIDLVLGEDGHDYAIEINPRMTTSYLGLRQLCQQNLAELILKCARGETIETPTWRRGTARFSV